MYSVPRCHVLSAPCRGGAPDLNFQLLPSTRTVNALERQALAFTQGHNHARACAATTNSQAHRTIAARPNSCSAAIGDRFATRTNRSNKDQRQLSSRRRARTTTLAKASAYSQHTGGPSAITTTTVTSSAGQAPHTTTTRSAAGVHAAARRGQRSLCSKFPRARSQNFFRKRIEPIRTFADCLR